MNDDLGELSAEELFPGRYWHMLEDGRVQCDVCPRLCKLREGQRGLCFVRARQGDGVVLTTYGRSSGFCIDPIEKKPLNHFLPGTPILSFGTAGCNLTCKFCQNWDISKSREFDTLTDRAAPEKIARAAEATGCRSVAFTYNDPVIFLEYAVDVAEACHARGIKTVAVTAGYVCDEPRVEFYRHMDAANVDLKGFTEDFYQKLCTAHLQPVLDTLVYLKKETNVWFEITTLLIPGHNDSDAELEAMTQWVVGEPRARRADPLHGLPPGLEDAGRAADAAGDAHPGARHRGEERHPLRLYRQRPRLGRRLDLLPRLRRAADRPRLVRARRLEPDGRGRVRALRHRLRRRLRGRAGRLGAPRQPVRLRAFA